MAIIGDLAETVSRSDIKKRRQFQLGGRSVSFRLDGAFSTKRSAENHADFIRRETKRGPCKSGGFARIEKILMGAGYGVYVRCNK